MQLTQKELTLLKDLCDSEKLCIEKYTKHSAAAHDAQLKNLFSSLASDEQKHLQTLNTIQSGTVPAAGGGAQEAPPTFTATYTQGDTSPEAKEDSYLCSDLLAGEKGVSHLYDTCIFEFQSQDVRDTLSGIQKREQMHGKMLYDYMKTNGMYS